MDWIIYIVNKSLPNGMFLTFFDSRRPYGVELFLWITANPRWGSFRNSKFESFIEKWWHLIVCCGRTESLDSDPNFFYWLCNTNFFSILTWTFSTRSSRVKKKSWFCQKCTELWIRSTYGSTAVSAFEWPCAKTSQTSSTYTSRVRASPGPRRRWCRATSRSTAIQPRTTSNAGSFTPMKRVLGWWLKGLFKSQSSCHTCFRHQINIFKKFQKIANLAYKAK